MNLLSEEEKQELISGICEGFRGAEHMYRLLKDFTQGLTLKALPPSLVFAEMLRKLLSEQEVDKLSIKKLLEKLDTPRFAQRFNEEWMSKTSRTRVEGGLMASITAICVERYLQNGRLFTKGKKSNDLQRIADGSRWEIKGGRAKEFKLTINQSHKDIDKTFFIVYNGFPERRIIHGVYILKGEDRFFTPRRKGLNMRSFRNEFFDKHVERILSEKSLSG